MENLSTAKKQLKCKKQLQGNDVTAARAGCQHTGTRKILSIVNLSFWAKYPIWKNEKQKKTPKQSPQKPQRKLYGSVAKSYSHWSLSGNFQEDHDFKPDILY